MASLLSYIPVIPNRSEGKEVRELERWQKAALKTELKNGRIFNREEWPEYVAEEARLYGKVFEKLGYVPSYFDSSAILAQVSKSGLRHTKVPSHQAYVGLTKLSRYPKVRMSELMRAADQLSFAILPANAVDFEVIEKELSTDFDDDLSLAVYNSSDKILLDSSRIFRLLMDAGYEFRRYLLCPLTFCNILRLKDAYFGGSIKGMGDQLKKHKETINKALDQSYSIESDDLVRKLVKDAKESMKNAVSSIDWVLEYERLAIRATQKYDLRDKDGVNRIYDLAYDPMNELYGLPRPVMFSSVVFSVLKKRGLDPDAIAYVELEFGYSAPASHYTDLGFVDQGYVDIERSNLIDNIYFSNY